MKTRTFAFTVMAVLAGMLVFSAGVLGARPPDAGNGGSGGGNEPPDYGDLIILYRDRDGVPYLTADSCWQPIAFVPDPDPDNLCPEDCVVASVPPGADVVSVDQHNCAVATGCAGCTQETDFGRVNEARSPDAVFDAQLADVIVNLATADCITLDPAGRLVASRVADGVVSTSTIDSPLQNLAIYRQLILTGTLGAPLPEGAGTLDTAARGLGAASDKTSEINVDLVAYLNFIMGLSDPATSTILDPKICIDVKEEVQGVVQLVQKCFLDYGAYGYDRATNFGALPSPAYIPEGAPEEGWFEYLSLVADTDPPLFEILQGPITTAVFADESFSDDNIGGFAQASDDTRAVISFMHENQVPIDFVTPVPCGDSGNIAYDVSISEESGLQVPTQMVDGGEGREFTVTVTNESASTDPATGTVTVTATEAEVAIDGSPWTFDFDDLAPGGSKSWTTFFTIDLGQRTTINWTATVVAADDVNLRNNSVTATTNVKVTGGGGRQ